MRVIQFRSPDDTIRVAMVGDQDWVAALPGAYSLYALAMQAIAEKKPLASLLAKFENLERLSYSSLIEAGSILPPILHPDPAHLLLTGTGLTHLGSASTRNQMHEGQQETITDSMQMFQWGIEGGKPDAGNTGVQPEWFYKGDGASLVAPYQPLQSPDFALDQGEEPEIAGVYVIGPDENPYRVGFTLANEFSDHITEKQNYLYLAHSKLRNCSIGPELLLGDLPDTIQGEVKIIRDGNMIWEQEFHSGEANMSHSIRNLEHHHFKYVQFRRPGDVHIHFFGTASLSFAAGIKVLAGDEMEISASEFGRALRNRVEIAPAADWELCYL